MAIGVGDVVRFKDTGPKGELGRVCKDNGLSFCVHFQTTGCLRTGKDDLELADGKAPECSNGCKNGC